MSMDLWETLRILRRRWSIVVALLALTAIAASATGAAVRPKFEARSTVLLLPPQTQAGSSSAVAVNPYLGFGGSLVITANIVVQAMSQPSKTEALWRDGARAAFALEPDPWGEAPTVTVVATDTDPSQATSTLQKVLAATRRELADRQLESGAPESQWIRAQDVTVPGKPRKLRSDQVRAVVGVVLLGVASTVGLAILVEGSSRRRARQRGPLQPDRHTGAHGPFSSTPPATVPNPVSLRLPVTSSD